MRKPWASSQSSRVRNSSWSWVSTPSATTGRSRPRASPMTARTMAADCALLSTLEMNERSILIFERKRLEIGQRRVSRAEIVHGDAHAQRLQSTQDGERAVEVVDQHAFGHLQLEPARR